MINGSLDDKIKGIKQGIKEFDGFGCFLMFFVCFFLVVFFFF